MVNKPCLGKGPRPTPGSGAVTDRRGSRADEAARRALDIVVATAILLVAVPALLVIALAIILESPGPVFYRAERVGREGGRLRMLKFRKMRKDARGLPLTTEGDDRLTRVGAFLVKTRLDEVPQLWHVLRGEMSLVGPRPEDPLFVAARAGDFDEILSVRPGLTGFSQLAFADERRILSTTDPIADYLDRILPQKCELDRLYLEQASLATNLRILAWTLIAVVLRRPVAVDRANGALGLRRRSGESTRVERGGQ
jgi:lipopolysaccharide/colanic/teichoic acid biosynthesis glycosyltransferase